MSRLDDIDALLASVSQHTTEPAIILGAETDCWRCLGPIDNDKQLGACNACIAALRDDTKPTQIDVAEIAAMFDLPLELILGPLDLTSRAPGFPCSTELIGAWPEPDAPRPIPRCPHADPDDGTCGHPEAITPECWILPDGAMSDCPPHDAVRAVMHEAVIALDDAHVQINRIIRGTARVSIDGGEPFEVESFRILGTIDNPS